MEADLGEAGSGVGKEVSAQAGAGGGKEAERERAAEDRKTGAGGAPPPPWDMRRAWCRRWRVRNVHGGPRGRSGALHSAPWE